MPESSLEKKLLKIIYSKIPKRESRLKNALSFAAIAIFLSALAVGGTHYYKTRKYQQREAKIETGLIFKHDEGIPVTMGCLPSDRFKSAIEKQLAADSLKQLKNEKDWDDDPRYSSKRLYNDFNNDGKCDVALLAKKRNSTYLVVIHSSPFGWKKVYTRNYGDLQKSYNVPFVFLLTKFFEGKGDPGTFKSKSEGVNKENFRFSVAFGTQSWGNYHWHNKKYIEGESGFCTP